MNHHILKYMYLACTIIALQWSCSKEEMLLESDLFGLSESQLYYWSSNEKHSLQIDQNRLIIRSSLSEQETEKQLADVLGANLSVSVLPTGWIIVGKSTRFSQHEVEKIKEISNLLELAPSFTFDGSYAIPTGEIVVKLKSGNNIDDILRNYEGMVSFVEENMRGVYILKVNRMTELLPIANSIFESGAVEWCHPDFMAKFELY
jgi:serine protease